MPRNDSQGALCFAPVRPFVRRALKSLYNQLLPECSSNQCETLLRCCQPVEDVHVTF